MASPPAPDPAAAPDPPAAPDSPAAPDPPADARAALAQLQPLLLESHKAIALEVHGHTTAAVLVPLYVQDGELHAVFTKRRDDLRRHAGEISFPGGREDPEDPDLTVTALREAEEEIGLPRDAVQLAGALPPIPTFATNYSVYPFVGVIEPGHEWQPSASEVELVLEFPLAQLRAAHGRRRLIRRGVPFRTDTFDVGDQLIWGATARILAELLRRLDGRNQPSPTGGDPPDRPSP